MLTEIVKRRTQRPMDGLIADLYEGAVHAPFLAFFEQSLPVMVERLPGGRLLDVGCGPGRITASLANTGHWDEVIGVDPAARMIELAEGHRKRTQIPNLRFEAGSADDLPFPAERFDAVVSTASIKHWPDPAAGLAEIARVLVPGGIAMILEMNPDCAPETIRELKKHVKGIVFKLIFPRAFHGSFPLARARELGEASPLELLEAVDRDPEVPYAQDFLWRLTLRRPNT